MDGHWRFVIVLGGFASSCGKTTEPAALSCADVFAAPRDGELLCDERIMANVGEVHWRSYATSRRQHEVFAPYKSAASTCHFGWCDKCSDPDVTHGSSTVRIYDAKTKGYPTCGKGPSPSHNSVIVVLEELKRPPPDTTPR